MSRIIRVFEGHFKKGMSLTPHQTSIEHQIMARSKVLDVAPGILILSRIFNNFKGYIKVHYELDSVNDINPMGMLHGGMTATLMDSITTWCNFVSREGHAGVTTDLSVSYLKGIDPKKHPTVTLVGRVDQEGLIIWKTENELPV